MYKQPVEFLYQLPVLVSALSVALSRSLTLTVTPAKLANWKIFLRPPTKVKGALTF